MTNCRPEMKSLVYTLKDRCKICYTCIRECPVKAISIINGQAEVIHEKCIACGNCVQVCSRGAKTFFKSGDNLFTYLNSDKTVIACVAPSFPAEFSEINDYRLFVGMLKELGFDYVTEVSFGADIVANEYTELLESEKQNTIISSDCPAIVNYVKHYHPELIESLAPIASPMVAMARIVREKYGNDIIVVFIGPCIAKKAESEEIDVALTFVELRAIFEDNGIIPNKNNIKDFDPPHSAKGAILPINRGLLRNIKKPDKFDDAEVITAKGHFDFREVITELNNGYIESKYIELLCCEGCIMGPGMSKGGKRFKRRVDINNYVKNKLENLDVKQWKKNIESYKSIDFSQKFKKADRRVPKPDRVEIDKVLKSMGKTSEDDLLNCGACGYHTCEEHAIAIIYGFAENEMCLPYTIEKLHDSIDELNESNTNLANAKQALRQSEKLASMGQLSAGIAHELNNPLGVITMYSNIIKEELESDSPFREDLDLIVEQAERCKNIVGGLLNFARKNQVKHSEVNIEEFVKRSLNSIIKPDNVKLEFNSKLTNTKVYLDTDQMMQVLTNLEKNAVEAMPNGGVLSLELSEKGDNIIIAVHDTGIGIPPENMEKVFTPFFTTKELGKGTGLGLPLIYGIVKMHKGKIDLQSNSDPNNGQTGTSFIITIPRKKI